MVEVLGRWNGHPKRISTAQNHIELKSENTRLVHTTAYQAGLKAWIFSATGFDKVLRQDVIEPATIEWTITILFASIKMVPFAPE